MLGDKQKRHETVQKGAFAYAEKATTHLVAALPDAPGIADHAMFAGTAAATLLGATYAYVDQKAGREEADIWLSQYLSLISVIARSKGTSVVLTISAKSGDVPKPEAVQAGKAAAPASKECVCKLNADGSCSVCPDRLKTGYRDMLGVFKDFNDRMQAVKNAMEARGPSCPACNRAYVDAAIAAAVLGLGNPPKGQEQIWDEILGFLVQMAATSGIQELPLTQAAWNKMAQKDSEATEETPSKTA